MTEEERCYHGYRRLILDSNLNIEFEMDYSNNKMLFCINHKFFTFRNMNSRWNYNNHLYILPAIMKEFFPRISEWAIEKMLGVMKEFHEEVRVRNAC